MKHRVAPAFELANTALGAGEDDDPDEHWQLCETSDLEQLGCPAGGSAGGLLLGPLQGLCPAEAPCAVGGVLGRRATLLVLVLIFISNQACRALLCYLVDFGPAATPERAINVALGFGSAEYGFLATMAFTLPFTVASLAAGVLADRGNRMLINACSGMAWSMCTICMAAASSYEVLLVQRGLLGTAQAATNPASLSLLADLFPESRATTSAIFGLGIYLGGGLASLGAAVDQRMGWRTCCLAYGVTSLLVSALALLGSDDRGRQPRSTSGARRRARSAAVAEGGPTGPLGRLAALARGALAEMSSRTAEATDSLQARWLFLAATFRFCAGFAILVWLPSAMVARFPEDVARFAVLNSMIKAFAGGFSSLLGGVISDKLHARGLGKGAGAAFCAAASLLAVPVWWPVLAAGFSFETCMCFLLAEYLVAESWLGPALSTLQGAVPPERRGAAQGVFSSLTALGNLLPTVLGFLPAEHLAAGLQASVALCYVASGLCFARAAAAASSAPPASAASPSGGAAYEALGPTSRCNEDEDDDSSPASRDHAPL